MPKNVVLDAGIGGLSLHKVRSGTSEPGYEQLIMKMLGITKLRSQQVQPPRNAA